MTKKWTVLGGGAIVGLLVAAVAVLAFSGTSSAQEPQPPSDAPAAERHVAPEMLAIAIGQLSEDDGETATVDLRATERGRRDQGNLRFFSEEYGYYNGGVRDVTCVDGVITAKGAGGLIQPDGTRIGVVYEATFDSATGETTIVVKGKDGFEYTMEGTTEGLIWCGDPEEGLPTF